MQERPRYQIEKAIAENDLDFLLKRTGELHGHYCSHLAAGVRAAHAAMRALGIQNIGMEEVVAIIETNNCFSDAIQVVTGCTFGNNALIYRDLGKTAVTLARRSGDAVRIAVKADFYERLMERNPEAKELFERKVARREELTEEENQRMMTLFRDEAFNVLKMPLEEIVDMKKIAIDIPAFAPIFDSVICEECKESVMESRARIKKGRVLCIECADHPVSYMDGFGIGRI
jgi:formylmethanofuran dehydrogenase subunit E